MEYTTIENIEQKLERELTAAEAEYFTEVVQPAVVRIINNKTGERFGDDTETTVYVSGSGGNRLSIPTMHDITAVSYGDNDTSMEVVGATEYVASPRGNSTKFSLSNINNTWVDGFDNYKITGKLGYADVPEDIMLVATELAINALHENDHNYKSEKVGDWQVTYDEAEKQLSQMSLDILASYRRLSRSI